MLCFYHFLKAHPFVTAVSSSASGLLSVWLADIDQLASWAAFLFSFGSFIIIAPKVWTHDTAQAISLRQAALDQFEGYSAVLPAASPTARISYLFSRGNTEDYDAAANMAHARADFTLGYAD